MNKLLPVYGLVFMLLYFYTTSIVRLYNRGQSIPFMTPHTHINDKVALPYGFMGVQPDLRVLLNLLTEFHRPTGASCAVVGSGRGLLHGSRGAAIDGHDIVFRFNDAPIRGYERHVGSKTTVRLFYPESMSLETASRDGASSIQAMVAFKPPDVDWLKSAVLGLSLDGLQFWRSPPDTKIFTETVSVEQLRLVDPSFLQHGKDLTRSRPTTGFVGLLIAISMCDRVTAFGFDGYRANKFVHYYDNATAGTYTYVHDFNTTMMLLYSITVDISDIRDCVCHCRL